MFYFVYFGVGALGNCLATTGIHQKDKTVQLLTHSIQIQPDNKRLSRFFVLYVHNF